MSKELTPWFPGDAEPIRAGVYETRISRRKTFQHWNGVFWGVYSPTPDVAERFRFTPSSFRSPRWRGLAKKP